MLAAFEAVGHSNIFIWKRPAKSDLVCRSFFRPTPNLPPQMALLYGTIPYYRKDFRVTYKCKGMPVKGKYKEGRWR